jgi:lipid-A-disaccharide synthase-like uncharacterized protein
MSQFFSNVYEFLGSYRMPFEDNYYLWKIIGWSGMAMFFGRFFIQWIHSEIKKESKVTVVFWWQSLIGTVFMLAYSLRQHDPIYVMGYVFNVVPYTRNLMLVYAKKRREQEQASGLPVIEKPAETGENGPVGN